MGTNEAFWLDREPGDAGERYDAVVRDRLGDFSSTWGDISPVTFACTAWGLAIPPSLIPGYARWHRRILGAYCSPSSWDGSLIANVTLVSPWPAELTWSKAWWRDRGWRDWPQTFGQFLEPTDQDLTRAPHLRAYLQVEAPLPLDELPAAPDGPEDDVEAKARHAVTVVVRELNALLGPLIRQLDSDIPADSP